MILERVQVEGWGCLRWPVELVLHPGVNLVYALNETGKTTLVAALRHALLEAPTAGIDPYRPWGSEVAPRVAVEFRTAAGRWRVEKVFARSSPRARLQRERHGSWEPVADEPEQVHGRTVALVTGAEVSGRRPGRESKESQRARQGVLYVLWREQGRPPLEDLELPPAAERDLGVAVGAAILTERDRRLLAAVRGRAAELLTAKRQEETGPLAEAAARLRAARETLEAQRLRLQALQEWQAKAEEAAVLLGEWERRLAAAREGLQRDEAAVAQALVAVQAMQEAESRLEDATAAWQEWAARLQALAQARSQRRAVETEAERRAAEVRALREKIAGLRRQTEVLEQEEAASLGTARAATAAAQLAQARLDLSRALAEEGRCHATLERARPLEEALAAAERQRAAVRVPPAAELAQLRQMQQQLAVEEAKLAAARLRASFEAEGALRLEVEADGVPESLEVAAGERIEREALERLAWRLPGVGCVRVVRTLETSLARQRQRVEGLRQSLRQSLAAWEAEGVAALEERAEWAARWEREAEQARASLAGLLPDGRQTVETHLAQLRAQADALRALHPELAGPPPTQQEAEVAAREAGQRLAEAQQLLEARRTTLATQRGILRECEETLPAAEEQLRRALQEMSRLAGRIEAMEAEGGDDTARQSRLEALAAARQRAAAEVERLRAAAPDVAALQAARDARRREVQSLEAEGQRLHEQGLQARVHAAALAEEGSYSDLVRAQEDLAAAESAYAALRLRADARALLLQTLTEAHQEQRAALFLPVQERVTRMWRYVSAARYDGVRLGDTLRPQAVLPCGYPEAAPPPESLSGGAQEQLGTIVRLALAEVLVEGERGADGQTLILDEPLAHSDPVRRRRLLELLADRPRGLQVVLLAQDPGDFASLPCDEAIDLGLLVAQSREAASAREPGGR